MLVEGSLFLLSISTFSFALVTLVKSGISESFIAADTQIYVFENKNYAGRTLEKEDTFI